MTACTQPGVQRDDCRRLRDVCGARPAHLPLLQDDAGAAAPQPRWLPDPGMRRRQLTGWRRIDQNPRLQQARFHRARLQPVDRCRLQDHQASALRLVAAAYGPSGRRAYRVPPAPEIDASQAIMKNPQIPEEKRFCPNCGSSPAARATDGPVERTASVPSAGTRIATKLRPGELVASQYEVAGCLAYGGLGWIYLAHDKNVSDTGRAQGTAEHRRSRAPSTVAIAELRFLAQVEHPDCRDLRLRHPRRRWLRYGVRRWNVVEADPEGPDAGDWERLPTAALSIRRWPTSWKSCRLSPTCMILGWSIAISSPTT